jgi:PTH2 family peptidyl-tRNA hydrolase
MKMVKQVIVVRKDLHMGVGKLISQACHASVGAAEEARKRCLTTWKTWMKGGGKKIIVKVDSLQALQELRVKAYKLNLPTFLVVDRGLTQLPPETATTLGIGPAKDETVDRITSGLKLL